MRACASGDVQQRAQFPGGEPDAVLGDDSRSDTGRVERPAGVGVAHFGQAQDAELLLVSAEDFFGHRVDHLGSRPKDLQFLARHINIDLAAAGGDHVTFDGREKREQPFAQRARDVPIWVGRRGRKRHGAQKSGEKPDRHQTHQGLTPGECRRRGSFSRACCD